MIIANTNAIWQQAAPSTYQLSSPRCSTQTSYRKIFKKIFREKKIERSHSSHSSQHYGHLCVYGLLKKTPASLFFLSLFFVLFSFSHANPTPIRPPHPNDCGHSTEEREEWEGKENVNFCDSTTFQHKVLNV